MHYECHCCIFYCNFEIDNLFEFSVCLNSRGATDRAYRDLKRGTLRRKIQVLEFERVYQFLPLIISYTD